GAGGGGALPRAGGGRAPRGRRGAATGRGALPAGPAPDRHDQARPAAGNQDRGGLARPPPEPLPVQQARQVSADDPRRLRRTRARLRPPRPLEERHGQQVVLGAPGRRGRDFDLHRVHTLGTILLWWYSFSMPRGNPSPKLAITVDPDVYAQVIAAAEADGMSVSAWMTAAARRELRLRDGLAAVAEWEAEHGALTEEELSAARRRV